MHAVTPSFPDAMPLAPGLQARRSRSRRGHSLAQLFAARTSAIIGADAAMKSGSSTFFTIHPGAAERG
jgi:ethanolamine utilization microcompartment shell protein EutL